MGAPKKTPFKYPRYELYAPAKGNNLHAIRDNRISGRPTDSMTVAVGRADDGRKAVMIIFPKVGVYYPIRTLSELERIRDGVDAIIDQIKRPGIEAL